MLGEFGFLVSKNMFLSFSTQNHAELFQNYLRNSFLNPKHVKLDEKSELGHVQSCPGHVQSCPSGPKVPIEDENPSKKHIFFTKITESVF